MPESKILAAKRKIVAANLEPGATRKKRYTREAAPEGLLTLTPVKVQMLRFLAEMRFLSLPQLARLCCPSEREDLSQKSARKHLRALFDAGLVDVLPVSRLALAPLNAPNDATLLYGSAPNVYAPTGEGLQMLYQAGVICREWAKRPPAAYGPKNSLFLSHELQVRDVRVWLERCARDLEGDQEVLTWKDGPEAAIDLGQEGSLRWLRPDAWFVYQVKQAQAETGRPTVLAALVEVDRGTERGMARWQEKIAAYGALFSRGRLKRATGYQNARVLVVAPDERRRDLLSLSIHQSAPKELAGRFWLAEAKLLEMPSLHNVAWRSAKETDLQPLVCQNNF